MYETRITMRLGNETLQVVERNAPLMKKLGWVEVKPPQPKTVPDAPAPVGEVLTPEEVAAMVAASGAEFDKITAEAAAEAGVTPDAPDYLTVEEEAELREFAGVTEDEYQAAIEANPVEDGTAVMTSERVHELIAYAIANREPKKPTRKRRTPTK